MAKAKDETPKTKKKSAISMRDKAAKAGKVRAPKRRVRTVASKVTHPIRKAYSAGRKEYHIIPQKETGFWGFMTKSRRVFPRYFKNSYDELKNVTWPSRRTTWKLVFAVFAFATVFGVSIAIVDYILENIFRRIIL